MRFTGINNSFYSQYLKATPALLEKLGQFQTSIQERTLGTARWGAVAAQRSRMSHASSFIDLFDVLKLMAIKTGARRDFMAISRHLIMKDDKRKNSRKVAPLNSSKPALTPSTSLSGSATADFQLAGYNEPMRRWLTDKMSSTTQTYHPVYRSYSCDFEDGQQGEQQSFEDKEGTLRSFNDQKSNSEVDPSVKSDLSRLERKLKRQNSAKSTAVEEPRSPVEGGGAAAAGAGAGAGAAARRMSRSKRESQDTSKNCALAVPVGGAGDDSSSSDSDAKDFVDFKSGVIGTPYRRQSRHEARAGAAKRYSL